VCWVRIRARARVRVRVRVRVRIRVRVRATRFKGCGEGIAFKIVNLGLRWEG
jgi:hypothetical protein